MNQYDLFETFPDGTKTWRGAVKGREMTLEKLMELAEKSENTVFAMNLATREVLHGVKQPKVEKAS